MRQPRALEGIHAAQELGHPKDHCSIAALLCWGFLDMRSDSRGRRPTHDTASLTVKIAVNDPAPIIVVVHGQHCTPCNAVPRQHRWCKEGLFMALHSTAHPAVRNPKPSRPEVHHSTTSTVCITKQLKIVGIACLAAAARWFACMTRSAATTAFGHWHRTQSRKHVTTMQLVLLSVLALTASTKSQPDLSALSGFSGRRLSCRSLRGQPVQPAQHLQS